VMRPGRSCTARPARANAIGGMPMCGQGIAGGGGIPGGEEKRGEPLSRVGEGQG
jgi:hypothetical protein